MDAFSLIFLPSSSPLFLSSKPYLPLLSRIPFAQSKFRHFFKNLPRVSTSESTSVVVPAVNPITTRDISGEKFDWYSHWYPVAPVCDLDKQVPRAVTVLGLDLVVWWDREEGQWRVFEDRCPHRLAPLSEGRIDPWGRLQCVYHGWCFDGDGNCKLIPQAPADGPPISHLKIIQMAGQYNNGSSSSSLSNQGGRLQREQERSSTSNYTNADEDYAAEIFRGSNVVDDTTSLDNMPPLENYNGPKVVIPPVPRDLNVNDQ